VDTRVIEYRVVCPQHGDLDCVVQQQLPRPTRCPECFERLTARYEVRRFKMERPLTGAIGGERFIG
jgi:hypothetical protein